ncbi:DEAD-box ATP-dependent RNA helicase 42, partial [Ophiophagus hannah]
MLNAFPSPVPLFGAPKTAGRWIELKALDLQPSSERGRGFPLPHLAELHYEGRGVTKAHFKRSCPSSTRGGKQLSKEVMPAKEEQIQNQRKLDHLYMLNLNVRLCGGWPGNFGGKWRKLIQHIVIVAGCPILQRLRSDLAFWSSYRVLPKDLGEAEVLYHVAGACLNSKVPEQLGQRWAFSGKGLSPAANLIASINTREGREEKREGEKRKGREEEEKEGRKKGRKKGRGGRKKERRKGREEEEEEEEKEGRKGKGKEEGEGREEKERRKREGRRGKEGRKRKGIEGKEGRKGGREGRKDKKEGQKGKGRERRGKEGKERELKGRKGEGKKEGKREVRRKRRKRREENGKGIEGRKERRKKGNEKGKGRERIGLTRIPFAQIWKERSPQKKGWSRQRRQNQALELEERRDPSQGAQYQPYAKWRKFSQCTGNTRLPERHPVRLLSFISIRKSTLIFGNGGQVEGDKSQKREEGKIKTVVLFNTKLAQFWHSSDNSGTQCWPLSQKSINVTLNNTAGGKGAGECLEVAGCCFPSPFQMRPRGRWAPASGFAPP